jgi:glucose/arabinose dehydrogenase
MAFLGPNDILVLDKNAGAVRRIVNEVMLPEPLLIEPVLNQSERGMLGIATGTYCLDTCPIFLYFTEREISESEEDNARNRLYRYQLQNNTLSERNLLLDLPGTPGARHNGGAMLIGPNENLYLTIGDVNSLEYSTVNFDTDNTEAKGGILRLTQDGRPVGSGIIGNEHPLNLFYAYGIRNSFGVDFDPVTGNLWDTENGETGNDEINLVDPGFNSGWNQIQGSSSQKDSFNRDSLVDFGGAGTYSDPEFVWSNYTVSPTAVKFLASDELGEEYKNDMFVGDFNNGNIYRFDLNEGRTELVLEGPLEDTISEKPEELQRVLFGQGFGAITDIEMGPDGYLYVLALAQSNNETQNNCNLTNSSRSCSSLSNPFKGVLYRISPIFS